MANRIRLLIADDHKHEREGFAQLLEFVNEIQVVGEATSAQEAVQKALHLRPDVVLLDLVWYKDRTAGINAVTQIKAEAPAVRILVMTAYPELIEPARREGADIAVDKDSLSDVSTLTQRIKDAYESKDFPKPGLDLPEPLTNRESEVLREVAKGKTDQEIAVDLNIALPTVKKHVGTILQKLGAPNRSGATAVAFEKGILRRGTLDQK